jgi:hypothetical protein
VCVLCMSNMRVSVVYEVLVCKKFLKRVYLFVFGATAPSGPGLPYLRDL